MLPFWNGDILPLASFTDWFFLIDPLDPPQDGRMLEVKKLELYDGDDPCDPEDAFYTFGIKSSWPGDTVTIWNRDLGKTTYPGTTFYLSNGWAAFAAEKGRILKNGWLVSATAVPRKAPPRPDHRGRLQWAFPRPIEAPTNATPETKISELVSQIWRRIDR